MLKHTVEQICLAVPADAIELSVHDLEGVTGAGSCVFPGFFGNGCNGFGGNDFDDFGNGGCNGGCNGGWGGCNNGCWNRCPFFRHRSFFNRRHFNRW